jgi:hypothetical protein
MGFRRSIGITIGLLALILAVVSAHAQAGEEKTITIVSTNTTTFFSAPFNFNGNGVANYAIYSGVSNLGKITGQGVSQSAPDPNDQTPCTLPDGSQGIRLALEHHVAVTRFERTGDLLYERGQPGDLKACLNPARGIFHEEGTVHIIGGTGGFLGASGFYDAMQDGQILVPPDAAQLQFGFATATYRYQITVPK